MSDCACHKTDTAETGFDAAALETILARFVEQPGSLVPVLQATQHAYGFLPAAALEGIARGLEVPLAEVFGVATFYTQFHLEPRGRHIVQVCHGTACHVKGATEVTDAIVSELGVDVGQTAEDGSVTVESVSCVGCCGLAPVVLVDEATHGGLDATAAARLARGLRRQATS